MIRTFSARLRVLGRSPIGRSRSLAADAGDTLIEVLISALLVALIVVGTFTGLNSTNKTTSLDRARSQADALAEQNEEQLRSEPIKKLDELEGHPETETVKENGSTYTIVSTAQYVSDATATASCTSSSGKAEYLQTTSKVTSPLIGVGKSVEETSIISPPPSAALIMQVQESGTALSGATATATGPSTAPVTHTLTTSASGCAIFALLPGSYELNVSETGYVDPDGYTESNKDPSLSSESTAYVPAEVTVKPTAYNFGRAGKFEVKFSGATEGDSFVAHNTGMTGMTFRTFGTPATYSSTVKSPTTIFPFTTKYTVYAGTCEADLPTKNSGAAPPEVLVTGGATVPVTVVEPPVNFVVKNGTEVGAKAGSAILGASGITTDEGCATTRTFETNSSGSMVHQGLPYGKYAICVSSGVGAAAKKWEGKFENNGPTGPKSIVWTNGKTVEHAIYLDTAGTLPLPEGTTTGECP
jgi:Tfp pilus assembly protein PilV